MARALSLLACAWLALGAALAPACAATVGPGDADARSVDAAADAPHDGGADAGADHAAPDARVATCGDLVPPDVTIYEMRARLTATVAGETVRLISISYGPPLDPVFPVPSTVCGVEDARGCVLHSASWHNRSSDGLRYVPATLAAECPTLAMQRSGQTSPPCVPSGLRHPVTLTPEYAELVRAEDSCILYAR